MQKTNDIQNRALSPIKFILKPIIDGITISPILPKVKNFVL